MRRPLTPSSAVAVSRPGYGGTEGDRDFCGREVEMTVFSRAGHHVPIEDRAPIIDRFFERYIGVRQRAE